MPGRNYRKRDFLKAYEASMGNVTAACDQIGVTRQWYYKMIKQDKRFKEKVEEVQERELDFSEHHLRKAIQKGNVQANIFHLECKGKSRGYIKRTEQETTVKHEQKASETDKEMLELFETLKGEKEKGHGAPGKNGDLGKRPSRTAVPQLIPNGDPEDLEL